MEKNGAFVQSVDIQLLRYLTIKGGLTEQPPIVQSPTKPSNNPQNVTLRIQNALLLCLLMREDSRLFLRAPFTAKPPIHLPPKTSTTCPQLPQLQPNISTTFVRSSIMGLKRKSIWKKPGLTAYILSCEFYKKLSQKRIKYKVNAVDNSS